MITAPLALAFTARMVATVNPCGFAMLPAYLSYFVGLDSDDEVPAPTRIRRALLSASIVSVGFLIGFGLVGTLVTLGARSIIGYVPWISIGIGAALAALGVAMLFGYRLKVGLPKLNRGGDTRSLRSVFLFGISYAVASLSCTLPVFLAIVSGTVTRENFASGLATFVACAAGMSVILFTVTVTVTVTLAVAAAAANHSIVGALRRASRHVDRAAGVLLIMAGTYIVYYWSWAQMTGATTTTTGAGPITFVANMSSRATEFIQTYQNLIVALFLVTVLGAVVFVLQAGDTDSEADDDAFDPDADLATRTDTSATTDSLKATGPAALTRQGSTDAQHLVTALAHSSSSSDASAPPSE